MSTVQKVRYALAAVAAVTAIGLMVSGNILTGILCLIGAVLLLPILYERLYIHSNEVQFLSPSIFLVLALFSFILFQAIPQPYEVPLKTLYSSPTSSTVSTTSVTVSTSATAMQTTTTKVTSQTQSALATSETVYRTPSGKRYHLDASCGGKNAYEVTYEEAVEAGLTPCKKCAGG